MTPACPACTAPDLVQLSKFELQCGYCRSSFTGKPLLCPACGWINNNDEDVCPDCGEPLNVVAQVFSRQHRSGTPQWLSRVQSQAGKIKSEEEVASRKRYEVLEEIDRRRMEANRKDVQKQRERDKGILIGVVVVFVVVALILLVLLLLQGTSSV